MQKSTAALLALAAFFCGISLGVLIAPAKNGITIGSNNRIGRKDDPEEYGFGEEEEDSYAF